MGITYIENEEIDSKYLTLNIFYCVSPNMFILCI